MDKHSMMSNSQEECLRCGSREKQGIRSGLSTPDRLICVCGHEWVGFQGCVFYHSDKPVEKGEINPMEDRDILYFKMQMLQAEIRMNGMIAENKRRESLGESLAYTEKDFVDLIEEFGIHHNQFPFYKG